MGLFYLAFALYSVSFAAAWTTYTVPYSSGGDDSPALTAAFSSQPGLAKDTTILFQEGVTYNILTPIKFPYLENVVVSVQGNLTYAADITKTQATVGSSSYPGAWFTFTGGSNVTLQGSLQSNWGWVNSNGQQWWDAMKENPSLPNRPHGWSFHGITGGQIMYMKLWQPVAWSFLISGDSLHIYNNTIHAVSSTSSTPSNTDGFDVQGTNHVLESNTVYNGDDCLAVGNSAKNIIFRNSYCNGGHGLSIGSLGKNGAVADVENILIENVVMENSYYGARFKSWGGGKGIATNVTWSDITLKKVKLPIFVTQNYWDDEVGNKSTTSYQSSTQIDTFTFQNFQGTIDDTTGNGFTGSTGKEAVILDLDQGTAKGILVKNIQTTTLSGSSVTVMCNSAAISGDVGFQCQNGLFETTAAGA